MTPEKTALALLSELANCLSIIGTTQDGQDFIAGPVPPSLMDALAEVGSAHENDEPSLGWAERGAHPQEGSSFWGRDDDLEGEHNGLEAEEVQKAQYAEDQRFYFGGYLGGLRPAVPD